jgi:large subunit ribosomal protein L18
LAAVQLPKPKAKGMIEKAKSCWKELAKLALKQKIKKVVFDRGGFIYTGQVKHLLKAHAKADLNFTLEFIYA